MFLRAKLAVIYLAINLFTPLLSYATEDPGTCERIIEISNDLVGPHVFRKGGYIGVPGSNPDNESISGCVIRRDNISGQIEILARLERDTSMAGYLNTQNLDYRRDDIDALFNQQIYRKFLEVLGDESPAPQRFELWFQRAQPQLASSIRPVAYGSPIFRSTGLGPLNSVNAVSVTTLNQDSPFSDASQQVKLQYLIHLFVKRPLTTPSPTPTPSFTPTPTTFGTSSPTPTPTPTPNNCDRTKTLYDAIKTCASYAKDKIRQQTTTIVPRQYVIKGRGFMGGIPGPSDTGWLSVPDEIFEPGADKGRSLGRWQKAVDGYIASISHSPRYQQLIRQYARTSVNAAARQCSNEQSLLIQYSQDALKSTKDHFNFCLEGELYQKESSLSELEKLGLTPPEFSVLKNPAKMFRWTFAGAFVKKAVPEQTFFDMCSASIISDTSINARGLRDIPFFLSWGQPKQNAGHVVQKLCNGNPKGLGDCKLIHASANTHRMIEIPLNPNEMASRGLNATANVAWGSLRSWGDVRSKVRSMVAAAKSKNFSVCYPELGPDNFAKDTNSCLKP